eukprot:6952925-Prymnesium_polylepis.1
MLIWVGVPQAASRSLMAAMQRASALALLLQAACAAAFLGAAPPLQKRPAVLVRMVASDEQATAKSLEVCALSPCLVSVPRSRCPAAASASGVSVPRSRCPAAASASGTAPPSHHRARAAGGVPERQGREPGRRRPRSRRRRRRRRGREEAQRAAARRAEGAQPVHAFEDDQGGGAGADRRLVRHRGARGVHGRGAQALGGQGTTLQPLADPNPRSQPAVLRLRCSTADRLSDNGRPSHPPSLPPPAPPLAGPLAPHSAHAAPRFGRGDGGGPPGGRHGGGLAAARIRLCAPAHHRGLGLPRTLRHQGGQGGKDQGQPRKARARDGSNTLRRLSVLASRRRSDAEVSAAKTAAAEYIRDGLFRLGPTFVKLGQVISTRTDVLEKEYIDVLKDLQVGRCDAHVTPT